MKVVIRIERGHVGLTGFAVAVTLASCPQVRRPNRRRTMGLPPIAPLSPRRSSRRGKLEWPSIDTTKHVPCSKRASASIQAAGTLLALGLCHERQGKTATAWSELKEALARAVQDGERDRQAVAKAHVDALEPKLSRLTIRIDSASAKTSGLTIVRDGLALARPAWGLATPVDPGEHHIEAAASNKERWSTTVRVDPDGASVDVDVPMLADVPAPDAATIVPAAPVLPPRGPSARTVGALTFAGSASPRSGSVSFTARARSRSRATPTRAARRRHAMTIRDFRRTPRRTPPRSSPTSRSRSE